MTSKVFGSSLATLLFSNKVYRQNKKRSKAFRESDRKWGPLYRFFLDSQEIDP
ncbi:hypothetical protein Chls_801 [Chlamydia suis]|uniref:Uncharacterized protein n=1 Tax=Chlamydia suis TaxID=83559 RepID=A0ABX6IRN3_9CHLA|nr:hypothetical protein Chls_801 [Chlamydia suis]